MFYIVDIFTSEFGVAVFYNVFFFFAHVKCWGKFIIVGPRT
jgi:hypothetical protein